MQLWGRSKKWTVSSDHLLWGTASTIITTFMVTVDFEGETTWVILVTVDLELWLTIGYIFPYRAWPYELTINQQSVQRCLPLGITREIKRHSSRDFFAMFVQSQGQEPVEMRQENSCHSSSESIRGKVNTSWRNEHIVYFIDYMAGMEEGGHLWTLSLLDSFLLS